MPNNSTSAIILTALAITLLTCCLIGINPIQAQEPASAVPEPLPQAGQPDISAVPTFSPPSGLPGPQMTAPKPIITPTPTVTLPATQQVAPSVTPAPLPTASTLPAAVPQAQPSPFPGAATVPPGAIPPAQPVSPSATQPGQMRTNTTAGGSSFYFDDADVFEVIQTVFGEVLRVNYIIDPAVKGRVNFRTVTPIPRDRILPVMEIILRLNGIAAIDEGGLYRIIQIANISKEPAPIRFGKKPESIELKGISLMQIVPLTYISSTEMSAILTPLLTQGGAIQDIPKRNMLILADTDANILRLLQVVAIFDDDTKKSGNQPRIYVYPVQNSKAKNVSEILHHVLLGGGAPTSSSSSSSSSKSATGTTTSMTTATPSAPNQPTSGPIASSRPSGGAGSGDTLIAPSSKIFADEPNNSLVILATPADYSVILSAIKQIDTIPRQVMIEAVVASITLTDNLTFGLKWNASVRTNMASMNPLSTNPITLLSKVGYQNIGSADVGTFGYTLRDKSGDIKVAIQALAATDKAKVLSAPQLLVADNKEAKIQVGSQIPLATSATTTPLTTSGNQVVNTTTSTIQYKDVGTILTVKPQINDSGLVSIEITQEVSSAVPQNVLGTDQFVINKNEVKTNLIVQDGETIMIGGMVSESVTKNKDGIPLLNKIPIINWFTGSVLDNKSRQEIVILLTPRVVRNPAEAQKMTSEYSDRFKNVEKEIDYDFYNKSKRAKKEAEKQAELKKEITNGLMQSEILKEPIRPDLSTTKNGANNITPAPVVAPTPVQTPTPAPATSPAPPVTPQSNRWPGF